MPILLHIIRRKMQLISWITVKHKVSGPAVVIIMFNICFTCRFLSINVSDIYINWNKYTSVHNTYALLVYMFFVVLCLTL